MTWGEQGRDDTSELPNGDLGSQVDPGFAQGLWIVPERLGEEWYKREMSWGLATASAELIMSNASWISTCARSPVFVGAVLLT